MRDTPAVVIGVSYRGFATSIVKTAASRKPHRTRAAVALRISDGLHQAASRTDHARRNHLQRPHMAEPARQGRRTLQIGRRIYRGDLSATDYDRADHTRTGAA